MARGNSWKTRNRTNADFGYEPRKIVKRELKTAPQFALDQLYISPFTQCRHYDADGHWQYVATERRTEPTGIRIMDEYLRYLAAGQSDMQAFADRHGLKTDEIGAMVFILTGLILAGVVWECVNLMKMYNKSCSNALPQFETHTGGESL